LEPEGPSEAGIEAWQHRLAAADPVVMALADRTDPVLRDTFALPLLDALAARVAGRGVRPLMLLNGPVGAGKSTLGRLLESLAPLAGLRLAVASIDDLYLPLERRRVVLAGNPFGVNRVPPGSHDLPLLLQRLDDWRSSGILQLPRFDKTLAGGQGERAQQEQPRAADALVLEGWLMGCRPVEENLLSSLAASHLAVPGCTGEGLALTAQESVWLPRWNRELKAYRPLWRKADGLWLLRPCHWGLPYRWRLQAEARQRRSGGGWMRASEVRALVRATLASLPPPLYQDPLAGEGVFASPSEADVPLMGMVELDGRRRCRRPQAQLSASSASSAIG
jgi:D-glycerate 3-kinase